MRDAVLLGQRNQRLHRGRRPLQGHVVRHRRLIGNPRGIDAAGNDQQIVGSQQPGRLDHLPGQLHALLPPLRVLMRERIRPEQERTDAADLNADLAGHLADVFDRRVARFRRQIALQRVIHFHAVKAGVLAKLQALLERHLLRIRQRPQVDRLLHVVLFPGRWRASRLGRWLLARGLLA